MFTEFPSHTQSTRIQTGILSGKLSKLTHIAYFSGICRLPIYLQLLFFATLITSSPLSKGSESLLSSNDNSGLSAQSMAHLNLPKNTASDTRVTLNHIELFAGCGGLSLGLESEGYELVFANELSPMAGETFAYNLLGESGEDLQKWKSQGKTAQHTFWLHSRYAADDLEHRLRENPREFLSLDDDHCHNDLEGIGDKLKGGAGNC